MAFKQKLRVPNAMKMGKVSALAMILLTASGCTFIMGNPPKALVANPSPNEVISPVVIYTSACDYQKKIDDIGWIAGAAPARALHAAEQVCRSLNALMPGMISAAGIKATFKPYRYDPSSGRPPSLKEDAALLGAQYVVAVSEPRGFGGFQERAPSVTVTMRLYDAITGEYRGSAERAYGIWLRSFSERKPSVEAERMAADFAARLALTLRQRCVEPYPYQCDKPGPFRVAEPRDDYGK